MLNMNSASVIISNQNLGSKVAIDISMTGHCQKSTDKEVVSIQLSGSKSCFNT